MGFLYKIYIIALLRISQYNELRILGNLRNAGYDCIKLKSKKGWTEFNTWSKA